MFDLFSEPSTSALVATASLSKLKLEEGDEECTEKVKNTRGEFGDR